MKACDAGAETLVCQAGFFQALLGGAPNRRAREVCFYSIEFSSRKQLTLYQFKSQLTYRFLHLSAGISRICFTDHKISRKRKSSQFREITKCNAFLILSIVAYCLQQMLDSAIEIINNVQEVERVHFNCPQNQSVTNNYEHKRLFKKITCKSVVKTKYNDEPQFVRLTESLSCEAYSTKHFA